MKARASPPGPLALGEIMEYETMSRKYLSGWLLGSGYDVTEAKDGAEALDFLDTQRF